MKKKFILHLLLLASIAGRGQTLELFYHRSDSLARLYPKYYTQGNHFVKLIGTDSKGNYLAEKCDTCKTWTVYDPSALAAYLDSFETHSFRDGQKVQTKGKESLSLSTGDVHTIPYPFAGWGGDTTTAPKYDTLKVIAKVYLLDPPVATGWAWEDSSIVIIQHVKAWEVWTRIHQEYKPARWEGNAVYPASIYHFPAERIKILSYNRKDELQNVLQTWQRNW